MNNKNNWPIKRLGEVADVYGGGTPPTSHAEYFQGDTNWFTPSELPADNVGTISESSRKISDVAHAFTTISGAGTVLLGSRASIGSVAILSTASGYNQGIKGIEPKKEEIDNWFLGYWLRANTEELLRKSFGTTFKEISTTAVKDLSIAVPPIQIQKQIVDKLNAVRKAQELIDLQIQKTEELFESLLSEIFNSYQEQLTPLGEICTFLGGGTPSKKNASYYNGLIPWITIKDMRENEIYDSIDHVTADAIKESAANLVSENTLLVATRVGLGKIAITRVSACFNQDIKALIPKTEIIPEYLLFSMIHVSPQIVSQGVGGTVKGVNLGMLKKLQIPFLSIPKQKEIVAKLNAIKEYKKLLLKQKQLYKELFDSVLYKSMNGELN